MAKIEFSANFKDAELVASAIKNLQKELGQLGSVGSAAGKEVDKSFKALGDSIAKIQEISKGSGSIKELSNQVDQLTKMGTSVQAFSRSFDSIGKAINSAIGDAQVGAFGKLKASIEDIKKSMDGYKDRVQEINYNLPIIEGRHGKDSAQYRAAQAERQGLGVAYGQMDDAVKNAPVDAGGQGGGYWARALAMGRSAIPYAMAGYAAQKVADTAVGFSTGSEIGEANFRNLNYDEANRAQAYRTDFFMRQQQGRGMEYGNQASLGNIGLAVSEAIKMIGGNILSPITGQWTSINQGAANLRKRQRSLDDEMYGDLDRSGQAYGANQEAFGDQYRMYGESTSTSTARFMRGGQTRDRLARTLGTATYYGERLHAYDPGAMSLLNSDRTLGVTEAQQAELIRMSRLGGTGRTAGAMREFFQESGAPMDINARRTLAESAIAYAQGGGPQNNDIAGATSLAGAATAAQGTGLYNSAAGGINVEGAQLATRATSAAMGAINNPMNIAHAMYQQKIIQLGISNPMQIEAMIASISQQGGKVDDAVKMIQTVRRTKGLKEMSDAEVRSSLTGAAATISSARSRQFGGATNDALKEAGYDTMGFAMTGSFADARNGYGAAYQGAISGVGDAKPMTGGTDIDYAKTGADVISEGKAGQQAGEINAHIANADSISQATGDAMRVYTQMAQSMIEAGKQLQEKVKQTVDDAADSRKPRTQTKEWNDAPINQAFQGVKNMLKGK